MKQNNNMKKKAAVITSIILGAVLVVGGAYYFFHTNVKPETIVEATLAEKQESKGISEEAAKEEAVQTDASETKEETVQETQIIGTLDQQVDTIQPTAEVAAITEKETQVAQVAPSKSSAASQQKPAQKATPAAPKSQASSKTATQPSAQAAASASQNSASENSGKRELYLPQGHYEERVVKPAYTAYNVQAFEEPVTETYCVFYGNDGSVLKEFPASETKAYTDANGQYHDPLTEYGLYVVRNHLGGGNWMVEQHQVDTIHHEAQTGLTEDEFNQYLSTIKNRDGLVYNKGTVPAETERVFVPNN